MDTGHWILNDGVFIDDSTFGFIYEICNTSNGRKYIGKKQCISRFKRKPLKGKKNKRIDYKESDWKSYTSSSNELNADIEKYGKDKFTFKILKACGSKWENAYFEIKEQLERNVLMRDDYYNGIINVRLCKKPKSLIVD
jgi:hypothetical protein